jgi:hypothetical protein
MPYSARNLAASERMAETDIDGGSVDIAPRSVTGSMTVPAAMSFARLHYDRC